MDKSVFKKVVNCVFASRSILVHVWPDWNKEYDLNWYGDTVTTKNWPEPTGLWVLEPCSSGN